MKPDTAGQACPGMEKVCQGLFWRLPADLSSTESRQGLPNYAFFPSVRPPLRKSAARGHGYFLAYLQTWGLTGGWRKENVNSGLPSICLHVPAPRKASPGPLSDSGMVPFPHCTGGETSTRSGGNGSPLNSTATQSQPQTGTEPTVEVTCLASHVKHTRLADG